MPLTPQLHSNFHLQVVLAVQIGLVAQTVSFQIYDIGADENQIFVLYAPNFYSYLDKDYRWDIAPSSAFKEDFELTHDLLNDKNLSIWVYNLSNVKNSERKSTLQSVFDEIDQLTSSRGQEYQVKVTLCKNS